MQEELTPAEKRKRTLQQRLGKDWRKKIGKAAKVGKIEKNGEDGYAELQSRAGTVGGAKVKPESRPFSRNKQLAKAASEKGLNSRWNKDVCVIPDCKKIRANIGHADKPARSKFCNYHRKGKGVPERLEFEAANDK